MRILRFFTVPTLLGWLSAYVTCVALHFGSYVLRYGLAGHSLNSFSRDYAIALIVGCIFIVLPTFLLVILPLSIMDFRASRRGRSVSGSVYAICLLAAGVIVTAAFASEHLTDIGWAESKAGQFTFFYLPFIPYAAVVAISAKRLLPQSPHRTLAFARSG